MPEKFEPLQHRSDLSKKLTGVKDKIKRREILDEEKQLPAYDQSRAFVLAARQDKVTKKKQEEELVREKERIEFFKEVEKLKVNFEGKIKNANRLVNQFFKGLSGDISDVPSPD